MKCPACGQEMTTQDFGVEVDVCPSCKGIWFDHGELARLDEHNEGVGAALEAALRSERRNDANRPALTCPTCSIPMHSHKYKRAKEVSVDECYGCGAFFLDSGELTEIRDHYMSDAEVTAYTEQLLNSIPAWAQKKQNLEAIKRRHAAIQAFAKLLSTRYWGVPF